MDKHHLDREIATCLTQQVLVTPDRKAQLLRERFDNTRCSLKVVSGYQPRDFIADADDASDARGSVVVSERQ